MQHMRMLPLLASALMIGALPRLDIPGPPPRKYRPHVDAVPAPSIGPETRQVRRQSERRAAKAQRTRDKLIARMAAKAWRRQNRKAAA
ncbi:MAG: hypothetical protein EOQ89_03635 [Mesorhizobium sp.]|nr:MAG: hypothetical protein EOQ89_03635 [Mesorhizobium sp.]